MHLDDSFPLAAEVLRVLGPVFDLPLAVRRIGANIPSVAFGSLASQLTVCEETAVLLTTLEQSVSGGLDTMTILGLELPDEMIEFDDVFSELRGNVFTENRLEEVHALQARLANIAEETQSVFDHEPNPSFVAATERVTRAHILLLRDVLAQLESVSEGWRRVMRRSVSEKFVLDRTRFLGALGVGNFGALIPRAYASVSGMMKKEIGTVKDLRRAGGSFVNQK